MEQKYTCPKIVRNYKFYQHPIKWIRDIKNFEVLNALIGYEWRNGLEKKVRDELLNTLIIKKQKYEKQKMESK